MTKEQESAVKERIKERLNPIFSDHRDLMDVVDSIYDDVLEDIEECADWSDYEADEINEDDVDMAIARIIKWKVAEC